MSAWTQHLGPGLAVTALIIVGFLTHLSYAGKWNARTIEIVSVSGTMLGTPVRIAIPTIKNSEPTNATRRRFYSLYGRSLFYIAKLNSRRQ